MQEDMEATTIRRRHTSSPVARAWNLAKDMNDSEKLELISIIIDSMRPTVAQPPMKPYTMDEINAMIDQSERDINEGRTYDFDEAMDELEREFVEEDRKLEMVEAV